MYSHDFGHLCCGRRILCIFHFYLGVCRYCVNCLSVTIRLSSNNIHYLCGRHLWCSWALFCEYCIRSRIIFHNIASEYNSTFCTAGIVAPTPNSSDDMSRSMEQSELYWCFSVPLLWRHFCSWLFSHPMLELSQVFPFLVHCCLGIWNLHRLRHRNELCTKL